MDKYHIKVLLPTFLEEVKAHINTLTSYLEAPEKKVITDSVFEELCEFWNTTSNLTNQMRDEVIDYLRGIKGPTIGDYLKKFAIPKHYESIATHDGGLTLGGNMILKWKSPTGEEIEESVKYKGIFSILDADVQRAVEMYDVAENVTTE